MAVVAKKQVKISKIALRRSLCRESYYEFFTEFWSEIVPEDIVANWHIKKVCNEVQEVCERIIAGKNKKYDLIINIPPGTTKSLICSIMLLPWLWTRMPGFRFLGGSFNADLSLDFGNKARRIIKGDLYRETFPEVKIADDQDTKGYFANTQGGERYCTSTGASIIGRHFHLHVIDDPINPRGARSLIELREANLWLSEAVAQRCVNRNITAMILVMQRLAYDDPSGIRLARTSGTPIRHICLPAEISDNVNPPLLAKKYKQGLLDPIRLGKEVLANAMEELGAYGYAGQYEQRPMPLTGGMIDVNKLIGPNVPPKPEEFKYVIRWWDKASTKGGGDYTAGVLMGLKKDSKEPPNYWVLDVIRKQVNTTERERIIRETAERDKVKYGGIYRVGLEQEPGPIWEEELVQMASGIRKKLKWVRKGEFVMDKGGKPTKVIELHDQGLLECKRIQTHTNRVICAANNHPFLTPGGWKIVENLKIRDILALKSMKIQATEFPSLEECRLAGYFIGDGCCTFNKGTKYCNAVITCSDPIQGEDIEFCAQSMGVVCKKRKSAGWIHKTGFYYRLSKGIRPWLSHRELAGKRTENKTVPSWVKKASNECVANFIGAFFSCDGSVWGSKTGSSVEFYGISYKLLTDVQSLLLVRFGIQSWMSGNGHTKFPNRKPKYTLKIKGRDGSQARFARIIPIYGMKKERLGERVFPPEWFIPKYFGVEINQIENVGKLKCRCLTTESGSFICNDFVVHNSGGKDSVSATIQRLDGFQVIVERPTGSKMDRANEFASQVGGENVGFAPGDWNKTYIEELRHFGPMCKYDDQVDGTSAAFNFLHRRKYVVGGLCL